MADLKQRTVVNFKEDCLDPLAKLVLLEAMSFAVEKAESRLESLGKIFPGLGDIGKPIIQDIKDIRFSVENLNVCAISAPSSLGVIPAAPAPPSSEIKQFSKHEQDLIKQMPDALQSALILELQRQTGQSVKEVEAATKKKEVKSEPKVVVEKEKKARTTAEQWGPLEFKGLSYSSPGFFLDALHGKTGASRGKGNQIQQLDADGFAVYIGDKLIDPKLPQEEMEKLKGVGVRVELKKGSIQPTPSGGKPIARPADEYPKPWMMVTDSGGKVLYFEDAKSRPIPDTAWQSISAEELDKRASKTRVAAQKGIERTIPGLPRGGKIASEE
jgi:hypothetical protein